MLASPGGEPTGVIWEMSKHYSCMVIPSLLDSVHLFAMSFVAA